MAIFARSSFCLQSNQLRQISIVILVQSSFQSTFSVSEQIFHLHSKVCYERLLIQEAASNSASFWDLSRLFKYGIV